MNGAQLILNGILWGVRLLVIGIAISGFLLRSLPIFLMGVCGCGGSLTGWSIVELIKGNLVSGFLGLILGILVIVWSSNYLKRWVPRTRVEFEFTLKAVKKKPEPNPAVREPHEKEKEYLERMR